MKVIIKYVRDMHVLQTKRIFRQLEREVTWIRFLWHPFVRIVIGWHLPALGYPILIPPWRATCLLRGGPRDVIVYDSWIIVLLLLLGWGLRWGSARRRPASRLWIESPITFRPLLCIDGRGKLGRWRTGITGRIRWGPRALIALWRVRGHAHIGRTYVRRVNSRTPSSMCGSSGGHVSCLHRRLGLRVGRGWRRVVEKRAEKPERVRYGESKRTGVLTTNGLKNAGRGFLPMRPSKRPWPRRQMRASPGGRQKSRG